jgi:hypothetical protein
VGQGAQIVVEEPAVGLTEDYLRVRLKGPTEVLDALRGEVIYGLLEQSENGELGATVARGSWQ